MGYGVFGTAIRADRIHDSPWPLFIPGISDGKLEMNLKAGQHGATMANGLNTASPVSVTSVYGDLEAVTCVSERNAEKRAGDSGDGIGVWGNLALSSFK